MAKGNVYDEYYQTKDLFGAPYPELIKYFTGLSEKGKLLDLGCGQGRNAIPLAELGFEVTGVDHSKIGVDQMLEKARSKKVNLEGQVSDIYAMEGFSAYNYILLDSMFHFEAKDKKKEVDLINRIIQNSKEGTIVNICIQDSGKKVKILKELLSEQKTVKLELEQDLIYEFHDEASNHSSRTKYKMIVFSKG